MSVDSSAPPTVDLLRVGEPFIPSRKLHGFYPPDFVKPIQEYEYEDSETEDGAAPRLVRRRFSSGAKLLYERLVRFAGHNGKCYPSQKTLATELGITDRQVRHHLTTLKRYGLIDWDAGGKSSSGRPLSARYVFLYHEIFERKEHAARLKKSSGTIQQFERKDCASSSGSFVPPNSVHLNPVHEFCTSGDSEAPAAPPDSERERKSDFQYARLKALVESFLGKPTSEATILRIVAATPHTMEAEAELAIQDALCRATTRRTKPRSASWFETVVRNFHQRASRLTQPLAMASHENTPLDIADAARKASPFDPTSNSNERDKAAQWPTETVSAALIPRIVIETVSCSRCDGYLMHTSAGIESTCSCRKTNPQAKRSGLTRVVG